MELPQNLGQRIVDAARLMVAAHLHASLDGVPNYGQRVVIGGAGPALATDGALPAPSIARSHRSIDSAGHGGAAE